MVAISIAPFLFPKSYTTKVLQKIIQDLYGPNQLGLKTLSQNDMAYRPRYINQDNIGDASVNNGQNYHNVFEVVLLADFSLGSRVGLACGSSAPSPDVFPSRGWEIDLFFSSSLVTSILILIWCYWSVVHRQSRSVSSKLHYIQHLVFSSRIDSKGWYFFLFSFFEPHPRRVLSGLLPVSMLVYCYYFGRLLYYFSTSLNCSWVLLTTIIV